MDKIADLIEARLDELMQSWIARVDAALAPGPRTRAELLDHMPAFLRQVIATLRVPGPGLSPVDGKSPVGQEHRAQRFRQGFELEAVVREYGLLLHLVLDLIEEAAVAVPLRSVRQLNDLFTSAIAEATAEYARRLAAATLEATARQNERLSQLFELAPAIIGHLSGPRHIISFANRSLTQLAGGRQLAGLPIAQALPELASQPLLGMLDEAYATGRPLVAREMMVPIDRAGADAGAGQQGLFDFVYQPTRGASGAVDGILIHGVEVTAAAQARREAERLKGQLETTLLSIADGVVATDAKGHLTLLNPAAERLTGWPADAALGQPVHQVLPLVDATSGAALPCPFTAVLQGAAHAPLGEQTLLVRRDGRTLAFADSLAAIRDRAGTIVGSVLVFRDETELRRKDAELRTFRAVVEASTDFIAFADKKGRPLYLNPAGLRLVGLPSQEAACAVPVPDYYTPETREATLASMMPVLDAGLPFQGEHVLRHFATGEAISVSQSAFPVHDPSGRLMVIGTIVRDRRDQKRAEAEREQLLADAHAARREADLQRAYLTSAFTQAPVAVAILHGDKNLITLANPGVCRIWGRTHEQVIQRPLLDALPEIRDQGFAELLAQVRRTGEPISGREVPATLARLDGGGIETAFLNFVYQPLRAADGAVRDVLVVAIDVTAEVQGRRAAEAVSAEFEAMFNSMPDGAFMSDATGVRRVNQAGLELLGLPDIEVLHRHPQEIRRQLRARTTTGEPLEYGRGTVERALTGEIVRDEFVIWNPRRQADVRLRSVASPIRVGDNITGAMVVHTDITEQHRALAALRRSEGSFRTLAEAIPQQVWTATPDGALDFVNQRVLSYFEATPEQVLGSGWQAVIHPEDLDAALASWAHSVRTREKYEVEFRLRRADGTYRWHLGRAFASLDSSGEVVKWFGTNTDIDEAKRIREELEHSRTVEQQLRQEAEQANRAKDEFLAMLGHELRNPLAPITTALQLMKLRADPATSKERTIIERQVDHLTRLVDDLLDVSRITGGKIELHRQRLELAAVVASAIEIASPLLEQRQHHLTVEVAPRGLLIDGDPVRLAQVVSNLLTNAAKYTEPGGYIAVNAAREGDQVVLRVKDNGIGIAADMLPRVFELFVQERQSIDRARGGLGLGLTIVRTLVKMHGGTVAVHSQGRGLGSEFTLRLPAVESLAAAAPHQATLGKPPPRPDLRRVLVVDDNADAAELLSTMLEFLGHQTRVAHDGPAALKLVESFVPDFAVLDIGLPVMDGYELAQKLRELPTLRALRLVALTGYGQEADRQRSAEAGFDAHLVKPIQIGLLEALLAGSGRGDKG
jgi:PAS domain S-box-containing protein